LNTETKLVLKGPRTKGPITAFVAKVNVLALALGGLIIVFLASPAFVTFFLPYLLNASVFWGSQKQGYIKLVIFVNYAFTAFFAASIFASIAFILENSGGALLPWWPLFLYLVLFGVVLCFISARKISRGYIIQ